MELVLATGNDDKIREIRDALDSLSLRVSTFHDFPHFPSPEETADTLEGNALIKARAVAEATQTLALADDTGLEVDALAGAPGVRSSRFAGPRASYADNCRRLLQLLKNVPPPQRTAMFRTVIAVALPEGKHFTVEGGCPGMITTAPRGSKGFGYDPIFQPLGQSATFAELPMRMKNRISHRAEALRQARAALELLLAVQDKCVVGITGSIGCGKSTLAHHLAARGEQVIDADRVGHQVLGEPPVREQLIQALGKDIIDAEGSIDRDRLRSMVCDDPERLAQLNAITHPRIQVEISRRVASLPDKRVFVEAALIFECNWDFFCDQSIVVACDERVRQRRVLARSKMTAPQLKALLAQQLSQREKMRRADYVVMNNEDEQVLYQQADEMLGRIRQRCSGKGNE